MIFVTGMMRSGTSMTAGIFHEHGVWFGKCRGPDRQNPRGFFENQRLKKALQAARGKAVLDPADGDLEPPPDWLEFVREVREVEGHRGGPWGVKSDPFTWPCWKPFSPYVVVVIRPPDDVARSCERFNPGFMTQSEWIVKCIAEQTRARRILDEAAGTIVETDRMVRGERQQIRDAIEGAGLDYWQPTVDQFIMPDAWHAA